LISREISGGDGVRGGVQWGTLRSPGAGGLGKKANTKIRGDEGENSDWAPFRNIDSGGKGISLRDKWGGGSPPLWF